MVGFSKYSTLSFHYVKDSISVCFSKFLTAAKFLKFREISENSENVTLETLFLEADI